MKNGCFRRTTLLVLVLATGAAACADATMAANDTDDDSDVANDIDVANDVASNTGDTNRVGQDTAQGPLDGASTDAADVLDTRDDPDLDDGQEPPFWQTLEPLASDIQENAVVAWGDEMVLIGGFANGFQILDRVVAYSPEATAWTVLPSLPTARHHVNAAAVGDVLYVLGGLSGFNFAPEADAWRLERGSSTWEPVTPLPVARGSAATVVVDGEIWLIGGLSGGVVADVAIFDPATSSWRAGPTLPEPRDHLVAAEVAGAVYVIGGRRGAIGSVESNVWRLTAGEDEWVPRTPMPTARGGCMAGVVDGTIIVAGGEGDPSSATGVFDDVEMYNPDTDSWTTLPPMPTPRHGTGAWGHKGSLFVPGGADVQAFGAVTTFEQLVLR